jgi:hypothetical protein
MKNYFLYMLVVSMGSMLLFACSQTESEVEKTNTQVLDATQATKETNATKAPIATKTNKANKVTEDKKNTEKMLIPGKVTDIKKQVKMKSSDDKNQWQMGTLTFLNFEGGFFGLVTDQGNKLLPMNLPKKFQQHKAKVKFKGEIQKGMFTIQQWGTPFKISAIELIELGDETYK